MMNMAKREKAKGKKFTDNGECVMTCRLKTEGNFDVTRA